MCGCIQQLENIAFSVVHMLLMSTVSLQSLTEDVISVILQLIEDEQKRTGRSPCSEPLAVQVAACIVSLCGWAAR